jgi:rubrerythrin
MSNEQEANCEHPQRLKGAWARINPQRGQEAHTYAIGWCCGACGHVETTGESPGQPHWATLPTLRQP